jgi:hypothetical protein
VFINFGEPITKKDINFDKAEGLRHQVFNDKLRKQFEHLVFVIPKTDTQKQSELLEVHPSLLKRILLFVPAALGFLIHAPLYLPVKKFTWKRTYNNDHYDSIMTAILLLSYPLYLLLIVLTLFFLLHSWYVFLLLILLPFTAWCYVQLKAQLDG